MTLAEFAPHLVGRMLPTLLTDWLPRAERFPGDPWAHQQIAPSWYWMHATGCPGGLYRTVRNQEFWQRVEQANPAEPRVRPITHDMNRRRAALHAAAVPARVPAAAPVQSDLFADR